MRPRANIHLDPDAFNFATAYAYARGIPLGAAVSELLRRAEQQPGQQGSVSSRLKTSPDGYLVKAGTGRTITPEMVKAASEGDPA